jgi:hypothetical protein
MRTEYLPSARTIDYRTKDPEPYETRVFVAEHETLCVGLFSHS